MTGHAVGYNIESAVKEAANNMINTINSIEAPTVNYSPKSSSSSGSKSGSGGKGGSGSGSKDKYTADIDKYKLLSDAVENVKDKIDELNDAYDATENIDEQIALKNVLISLYKDEQDALTKLNIGSQTALVNGKEQFVDQPPRIDAQTGRTLVPLRFIAQTLGNTVLWDGKRRKITILKK